LVHATDQKGKSTKLPPKTIKFTLLVLSIPNGLKMHQRFTLQGSPKYTQIGTFGMKIIPPGNPVPDCSRGRFFMRGVFANCKNQEL
jgi:hypothetical protein